MSTSGTKRPASASSNGRAQKKRARISFQEDEEEEERMEEESEDAGLSIRDLSQVHTQDRGDCEDKSGVRTNKVGNALRPMLKVTTASSMHTCTVLAAKY